MQLTCVCVCVCVCVRAFFIKMFACAHCCNPYENPRLIVEVFGHVHDLKHVRTNGVCDVEKCNNVSMKSRWCTKLRVNLRSTPMQG